MRTLRFRAALTGFLRRWSAYVAIVVVLAAAGTNAPVAVGAALAASLLGPLRAAAEHGWAIVPATIAYALVGALPTVLTRQLWWPRSWALAERALPLDAADVRGSDVVFGRIVMAPWQGVLLLGGVGLATSGALDGQCGVAVTLAVAWSAALVGASWLSLRWMRHVRRGAGRAPMPTRSAPRPTTARAARATSPVAFTRALLWLPIVRGRATRTRVAFVAGSLATATCAATTAIGVDAAGWSLAALALVALTTTSVTRACAMRELRPLWADQRQLPLVVGACDRRLVALVTWPSGVGIATSFVATASIGGVRSGVLAGYGAVLAVGCVIEALTPPSMDPTNHTARWILLLSIAVAFASEVVAG